MTENELKLGMQPFWFWNGEMDKGEIVRQILEMKDKGVPGFMIHPRQGMEIPYMSREFFDRVKLAVRTARDNGMEVWIYDEYPYPSGICAGEVVLEHSEYLCRRLRKSVCQVMSGESIKLSAPWGRLLLARAYRIDRGKINLNEFIDLREYVGTSYEEEVFQYSGLTQYNKKRYFTGHPAKTLVWNAPSDEPDSQWRVYLVTEAVLDHFKYFGNFIDTLNPKAIKYFIEMTHERYKKEIGEEFGKTVKGFFTDETTAFPDSQPWSPLLPNMVKDRFGIDLVSCLPALWEDLGDVSAKVRYAYWCTATDAFIDAYDRQIFEWCSRNGLLYIGEKPIMRSKQLKYVHVPGIDAGHQKAGDIPLMIQGKYRANGKIAASAAHFYGKPAALCEIGHSIGWGMTMQDMKWIFDWLGILGIDWFVIHGFFYTADGLKKHDAPPSAFFQMPWWEDAGCITEYAKRLGKILRFVKRDVRLLVLDPVTSTWTAEPQEAKKLKDAFADLQTNLMSAGLDYYIIDPELFAEGEVAVESGGTRYMVNGEYYGCVLLPPMTNVEEAACKKLKEYMERGGNVCAVSCVPYKSVTNDNKTTPDLPRLFGIDGEQVHRLFLDDILSDSKEEEGHFFAARENDAVKWLKEKLFAGNGIEPLDGLGADGIPHFFGRDSENRKVVFLVNSSPADRELRIDGGGRSHTVKMGAFDAKVYCLEDREFGEVLFGEEEPAGSHPVRINMEGIWNFHTEGMNALRLGWWDVFLPDGQSAFLETAPLIDQMEAGGFSLPVTQASYFGCPKELKFPEVEILCEKKFLCKGLWDDSGTARPEIYLAMESGTFRGNWEIEVNDCKIDKAGFTTGKLSSGMFMDSKPASNIGAYLKEGVNLISVRVKSGESFGGFRNPLYLFGDFGVYKEDGMWSLAAAGKKGDVADMASLGLPFYCGELVIEREIDLPECDGEFLTINLTGAMVSDSIRIEIGEYETDPCAWKPYRYRIPAEYVKSGKQTVRVKIRNTALGLFEGQKFDTHSRSYVEYEMRSTS